MTDHYRMTRHIREIHRSGDRLPYCIGCHRVRLPDDTWVDYGNLPLYILKNDITGAVCPGCMDDYRRRKEMT